MTGYVAEDLANVIKNNSGLEQLFLSGNDLKLSAVVILQALTNNWQLKILNLSRNSMTGQVAENLANVIKNNSGLEELYLSDNDIKLAAVVILQALKNNSQLKILNLNNNMTGQVTDDFNKNHPGLDQPYLSDEDLKSSAVLILQALENNSQLQKLSLNSYYISGRVAEDLAYIIINNPGLEELYLSDNDLISSTVMNLQALIDNSQLKILALNNIKMTQQVVEDLAVIIKNCSNLQLLNLRNNALGSSAVVILQALEDNCQLKILDLSNNRMTGHVTEDLANVIVNNPGLVQLSLSDNYLNSSIVMVLQVLNHLETLSFSSNNMTGQIAEDLANIIKNNASLKILDLSDNDLKSLASVILQGLKDNSQLKLLALNSNNITGQLAEDLAIVIKNNSGLEGLYLSNNNLKSSAIVILQALENNTQLGFLHLNNNRMTGRIAENLANVIKNNLCLKELDICNNDLKSYVIVILQALCSISHLEMLSLDNNFLTDLTSIEIISVMKSNPLITKLWLGDNMLQSALIDITVNCKSLKNLQALGLSHNSINPTEVPHLASVVANINSLQVLLFGGLVLNVEETFLFQFYNACNQKLVFQSNNNSNDNELLEIGCLVLWRLQFAGRAKYYCYDRNVFWTSTTIMQAILVDIKPNLNTVLSPAKQLEQRMSQLEATNMIISLFVIIKSLKVLDLGHSNINKEAAVELATALNCNNVLEQLWLTSNILGADGVAIILTSLQNISTLRILDLSYNNISSSSANGIVAVINSNQLLEQLWLDGNMLMTTGVVAIASVLKKCSNLRLLSLSNNEITEDAAEEIAAIVNTNTLLGGLLLSNNELQSIGIYETVKSVSGIECVHILELTDNCIDSTAADKLAVTLSCCTCLKELYLGNNNLGTAGVVKICQVIKNIQILRVLSLNNNNITTEAASEICNVISTNTNLDILLLGGNDLQTAGALQIADTVKNNNLTMQLLSLSDNSVDEQVKDIKLMLYNHCDLELFI